MKMPITRRSQLALAIALTLTLASGLSGCASSPLQSASAAAPKPALQFVDLQAFDRDLAGALQAPLPKVDVSFYDRTSPNALPERLQPWMAAVEAGGGTVKVVPPPTSVAAKSPFMLISAVASIWSASKMARELSAKAQFSAAQAYDAEIVLKQDDKGDSVVDKVVFVQRKK